MGWVGQRGWKRRYGLVLHGNRLRVHRLRAARSKNWLGIGRRGKSLLRHLPLYGNGRGHLWRLL